MGKILSSDQCKQIRALKTVFEPFAAKGWMCEGSDAYGLGNVIFNNDTEEAFWADYNGNILHADVTQISEEDMKTMAFIHGKIRKIIGD